MVRNCCAALALLVATGVQPATAQGYAGAGPERLKLRDDIVRLVNVAQQISGATALYTAGNRRPPTGMDDLFRAGLLDRDKLWPSPAARPGATWRLVRDGRDYAEIPLATADVAGPECREVTVQAGKDNPRPQFSCHAGPDGVTLRFAL